MKKTQFKDARRNIKKQFVSFLSIAVIAALGVTMFLGINYSAEAMNRNGSAYYDGANFRDVEVVSTRLLSPQDMEILRGIEGVKDVEGILMTQGKTASDVTRKDVYVVTAGERISVPTIVEGRLPETESECAVEKLLAEQMGWKTGDEIEVTNAKGEAARFLRGTRYTVTGVVTHPDHVCGSVPDTLYVVVAPEAFDLDFFEGSFMKAEIAIDAPASGGRFKSEYSESVGDVMRRVEAVGAERAPIREKEVDALIEEAAKEKLRQGWETIEQYKEEVRENLRSKLTAALGDELGENIVSAVSWVTKTALDLGDRNANVMMLRITEHVAIDLNLSMQENLALLVGRLIDTMELPEPLSKAAYTYLGGEGAYDPETLKTLLAERILPFVQEYESEYNALAGGCRSWDDIYRKYLDGTLWSEIGLAGACRWIVTDIRGNMSFVQLSASRDSLVRMEMTFSLLFVAVGALVIYATVSKQVDEQRSLVGTTKALGFYQREIFAKYLTFGVSATVVGAALGLLIARLFVVPFILNGYQLFYRIDIRKPMMTVLPTIAVFTAAILLAFCAVWFACRRLLKTPAVALMLPETPRGRKKSSNGSKRRGSLYSRLIFRNIRSDLKRVIVTVVSIAGCCTLIVIGFTLKRSVDNSLYHQFNDVVHNDGTVTFDPDADPETGEKIGAILRETGVTACPITDAYITVQVRDLNVEELFCGDLSAINDMFRLNDAKTGAPLALSDDGIYIPKRFSEFFGVQTGDRLEITLNGTETASVTVVGVFNNYMNSIVVMSAKCFENTYGRTPVPNAYLVRLNGADADPLEQTLRTIKGYGSYKPSDSFRKLFNSATSVMGAVVMLFIFMAGVMAGVVVLNLTNIYIMQKKRELVVMRINGFTVKETIGYVLRETVVTTAAGILLGIALGAALGYAIVRALEQPFVQFDRSVSVVAWILAAAITLVFVTIINAAVLRKVKNLKLTDAA
jgi:ABC-type antimicrobial peptide transport system permease subunit